MMNGVNFNVAHGAAPTTAILERNFDVMKNFVNDEEVVTGMFFKSCHSRITISATMMSSERGVSEFAAIQQFRHGCAKPCCVRFTTTPCTATMHLK